MVNFLPRKNKAQFPHADTIGEKKIIMWGLVAHRITGMDVSLFI